MKERLFFSTEVATMFGVSRKTIARWADRGLLECNRTAGGHLRFTEEQISNAWEQSRTGPAIDSESSLIP